MSVLAHEAGHGLHGYYASKEQGWTNFRAGSCLAESASIFGQLLLTDKLLSETNNDSDKIALLCSVIDSFRLLTSDMLMRYEFETNALNTMKNNENLDADKLDSLWTAARDEVYGNAIEWPLETKTGWAVPVHHYMPNYRFYNYPYAFGQLLVYALYGLYKKKRGEFVPKLKQILSYGSSKSPKELLAEVGFDITDPKFWEIGFKQAEEFIDELEKLVG